MSHHQAQQIRRKLAPFMQLVLAVACMGLLASCGGGGSGSQNQNPVDASYTKVVHESDFITGPDGSTIVKNIIVLAAKDDVQYQTVLDFINQNKWALVGYVSGAGLYQVEVGNTDLVIAKNVATKSELFEYVRYSEKVSFDTIENRWNDSLLKSNNGRWNLDAINLDQAYTAIGQGTSGYAKVAVVDGGFRKDHSDIAFSDVFNVAGQSVSQATGCSLTFLFDNYECASNGKKNAVNHGMNVAGVIAASQNNTIGTAGVATRFAQVSGYEIQTHEDIVNQIQKAIIDGNKIINLSLNKKITEYSGVSCANNVCAISAAVYEKYKFDVNSFGKEIYKILKQYDKDEQVLFVKSSGNDGDLSINVNGIFYQQIPSKFNGLSTGAMAEEFGLDSVIRQRIARQTIVVGAFHMDNGSKTIANYTEFPDSDVLISNNFMLAPGGGNIPVLSTGYTKEYNNDYYYSTYGTSQATPHVTGVAALVWQTNPSLTAEEVKNILLKYVDFITGNGDNYKALNAEKAVKVALATKSTPQSDAQSVLAAGTYTYSNSSSNTCYSKSMLGSSVSSNEYRTTESQYCLNAAKNGWVLNASTSNNREVLTSSGWVNASQATIQFPSNAPAVIKIGGVSYSSGTLATYSGDASYPSGSRIYDFTISQLVDEYSVYTGNSYISSNATSVPAIFEKWNTRDNGHSYLKRGGDLAWAFDSPSSSSALSGVVRFYNPSEALTCTATNVCSRTQITSATWVRATLSDGSDSIELRTPSGYADTNLSGYTGEKVIYVKRSSDAGIVEGSRRVIGATSTDRSYNRTYFDSFLQKNGLPATLN